MLHIGPWRGAAEGFISFELISFEFVSGHTQVPGRLFGETLVGLFLLIGIFTYLSVLEECWPFAVCRPRSLVAHHSLV